MGLLDEDIAFHSNIPVPLDITVAVVYSVFGVCSLFGNSTLLYVSYKKKHLLKPAECFIINLAVSDLGLTLSLYPMAITSSFYHRWLYGKTVCSMYAFCGMLFGICSLTTLTLLSMVCFVKVCYPLYGNRFNCVHGRLLIACAWIYALLFACSPLAHWGKYGPEPYGTACCIDWRLSNQHSTARSYTVALFIFCYILPCCVITASYMGILVCQGNRFNCVHGRLLIACAWIYALLFACSPLAHWGKYGPEPYGTACCIDWRLSNQHSTARSYTVALFIFCYILPCCVITASYMGILVTVQASRKNMEQHASRQTHMSSIQRIIVKLSVAVCIGFFAAWSPYAVVSMWAAFGHIENIPPLAFALPAMFAKSSTIYNPIIYLMLRPNIRRLMRRDLGALCHTCLRGCLWSQGPAKCCSKPEIRVRLRSVHRHNNQFPSSNSSAQPPMAALKDHSCEKCKDAFECFRHYPQMCSIINPAINGDSSNDQGTPVPQTYKQKPQSVCHKKSLLAIMCAKRTSEIDNFHINLEMVPGHAKVAWP